MDIIHLRERDSDAERSGRSTKGLPWLCVANANTPCTNCSKTKLTQITLEDVDIHGPAAFLRIIFDRDNKALSFQTHDGPPQLEHLALQSAKAACQTVSHESTFQT